MLHLVTSEAVMFHSFTATKTQHISGVKRHRVETLDTTGGAGPTARENYLSGVLLNWANINTREDPLSWLPFTPRFRVFLPNGTKRKKLSNPKGLAVAGTEGATGINTQLSHELKITKPCKLAKLKPLHLLCGDWAAMLFKCQLQEEETTVQQLCHCLNVKPLGCGVFVCTAFSLQDIAAVWLLGVNVGWSVGWSSLVRTEISPWLEDGQPWHLVQTFVVPSG